MRKNLQDWVSDLVAPEISHVDKEDKTKMKVNSENSSIHSRVNSERSFCRLPGPEFDGGKNIQNDSEITQAQSAGMDAKGILNTNGELRRFVIDKDMDQADMAAKTENQRNASIKQQILEYPSGHR